MRLVVFLLWVGLLWGSGCVSKKKFKRAIADVERYQKQLRECKDSLTIKGSLIDTLTHELQAKTDNLAIEQERNAEMMRIADSLREVIQSQVVMIETCQETLDNLKTKSAKEIQQLIETLEAMQKDLELREQKLKSFEQLIEERDKELKGLIKQLQTELKPYEELGLAVELKDGEIMVSLSNQLLFALGSTEIDKQGKDALRGFAKVINGLEKVNFQIYVEGHTDDIPVTNLGDIKDNWDLSVMRSTEVIRFLTKECKVNPRILVASGRGQYEPVKEGKTNEARAKNRRTEILIVPNLTRLIKALEVKEEK